jgi:hypothetical protein
MKTTEEWFDFFRGTADVREFIRAIQADALESAAEVCGWNAMGCEYDIEMQVEAIRALKPKEKP